MSIRKRGKAQYQVRWPGFPAVTLPTKEAAEQLELHFWLSARLGDHFEEPRRRWARRSTPTSGGGKRPETCDLARWST